MKARRVLYLDDEQAKVSEYRDYLSQKGLTVVAIDNIDEGLDWIERNYSNVDVVVLDAMLPWGTRYDGATTDHGLLTGLAFYKDVRRLSKDIFVFVLTNNTDPAVAEILSGDPLAQVVLKTDFLYDEFGNLVLDTIASGKGALDDRDKEI